jgi:hypothetical protein
MVFGVCPLTLTDVGYTAGEVIRAAAADTASLIRQAASALIAIDNAARLVDNYKKQRDIQDRMLDISEEQQAHMETVYWPREIQFLNEFSVGEAIEAVEVMGKRYAGRLVSTVAGAFAPKLRDAKCSASRYCTSATTKNLQDLLMARSAAMANARVLGRNIAFAEYQARLDVNLERRLQAAAIGRDLMNQAASLYQAAGQGLAAAGGILSGQLGGAIQAFGNARNFRDDLRVQAYERAQNAQNVQAPQYSKTAPMAADGRPTGQALQETFGYDSSMKGAFDKDASSNTFKSDPEKIIDKTQTLMPNQMQDSLNSGPIGQ